MASPCRPACGTWSLSNRARPGFASDFTRPDGFVVTPPPCIAPCPIHRGYVFVRHQRPFFPVSSTKADPKPVAPSLAIQRFLRSGFRCADPRGTTENLGCTGRSPVLTAPYLRTNQTEKEPAEWTTISTSLSIQTRGTPSRAALSKSPTRTKPSFPNSSNSTTSHPKHGGRNDQPRHTDIPRGLRCCPGRIHHHAQGSAGLSRRRQRPRRHWHASPVRRAGRRRESRPAPFPPRRAERPEAVMTDDLHNDFGMKCPKCGASDEIDVCADTAIRSDGPSIRTCHPADCV